MLCRENLRNKAIVVHAFHVKVRWDGMDNHSRTYLFTCSSVSTVSQTAGGWFGQLVDIESSAVSNTDISVPLAIARRPMETHFTLHGPFSYCRMPTSEIPWRMRTTMVLIYNGIGHFTASKACEPIPSLYQ